MVLGLGTGPPTPLGGGTVPLNNDLMQWEGVLYVQHVSDTGKRPAVSGTFRTAAVTLS